jgi:hypothetical protein
MLAAGWISMPVAIRLALESMRGSSGISAECIAWEIRCARIA